MNPITTNKLKLVMLFGLLLAILVLNGITAVGIWNLYARMDQVEVATGLRTKH